MSKTPDVTRALARGIGEAVAMHASCEVDMTKQAACPGSDRQAHNIITTVLCQCTHPAACNCKSTADSVRWNR